MFTKTKDAEKEYVDVMVEKALVESATQLAGKLELVEAQNRSYKERIERLEQRLQSAEYGRAAYSNLERHISRINSDHHYKATEKLAETHGRVDEDDEDARPYLSMCDPKSSNHGGYPFIPLEPEQFTEVLLAAKYCVEFMESIGQRRIDNRNKMLPTDDGPRFLDVGAGTGTKLGLAEAILGWPWVTEGIEFDPTTQQHSHLFCHSGGRGGGVKLADGRTFEHYGQYRIIYMYCPMQNPDLQRQLERAAYNGAANNTILIQFHKQNSSKRDQPHLHCLHNGPEAATEGSVTGVLFLKSNDKALVQRVKEAHSYGRANNWKHKR